MEARPLNTSIFFPQSSYSTIFSAIDSHNCHLSEHIVYLVCGSKLRRRYSKMRFDAFLRRHLAGQALSDWSPLQQKMCQQRHDLSGEGRFVVYGEPGRMQDGYIESDALSFLLLTAAVSSLRISEAPDLHTRSRSSMARV